MTRTEKNNLRLILVLVGIITLIALVALFANFHRSKQSHQIAKSIKIDGMVLPKPRVIGKFQLTDEKGQPFSKQNLKGHWTLMFFGFTNCGYVCPTTMSELAKMYTNLKAQLPSNLLPQVVMVSVDPDRDSRKRIKEYVKNFNPAFHAARGNIKKTKQLTDQMSVVFSKVKMPTGNYTVTHSAEVIVLDPNGNLRAFLSYPHHADQMTRDYEAIVRAYK